MKTEIKAENKGELFEDFEAIEQVGIDLITSKQFDHQNHQTLVEQQFTSLSSGSTEKSRISFSKPDLNEQYRCHLCQDIFKSVALRKTHIELAHKTYKCDICKGVFESKQDCLIHIESIHSHKPTPRDLIVNYKCHICNGLYKSQFSLACHLKKVCLVDQTEKSANLRNFACNKTKKRKLKKTIDKSPSENKVGESWDGEKEYFDLPYGWTKQVVYLRNQQSMKGKVRTDIYLKSPAGPGIKRKTLRNDTQVRRFLVENPHIMCDLAVTSTSKKKHREFLLEVPGVVGDASTKESKSNQIFELDASIPNKNFEEIVIKEEWNEHEEMQGRLNVGKSGGASIN